MNFEEKDKEREKVEAIRQFVKDNGSYFSIDKEDFKRGKTYASGSGWQADLGRSWGEGRANIHLDIVSPICDSTVNSFTRNPFAFSDVDSELQGKINKVLAECLREACQEGLSFIYLYHEDSGELKVKRLSNLHVMYTETECLVIDKKKTESYGGTGSLWNNIDGLALATNEIPVLTHFIFKDGVVEITKIEDESIVASTSIPLPSLPIIPVRGRQVFLSDNQVHWRGYHFMLRHLCSAFSANLSVTAERMICRDPVFLPEESLGDNEYSKQWEENAPRNYYIYKSLTDNADVASARIKLDPPIVNPQVNDISKLETSRASILELVDRTTGSNYASENKGNETATAVLLRNQNKEDALSQMLMNLGDSAKQVASLLEGYLAVFRISKKISVVDNVTQGIKNSNAIQLLLSVKDLPIRMQLAILQTYDAPPTILEAVAQELEQQNDPARLALEQENGELKSTIQAMRNENKMAEATHAAAVVSAEQQYATRMAQIESSERIKVLELENDRAKLILEKEELELKLKQMNIDKDIDLFKIDQKERLETAKINNGGI
ncbi:MAG: hypothetical protein FWF63_00440 [Fibromonadales bacterium]|nr:hypothetical protein [Fibromonadales bacterium]